MNLRYLFLISLLFCVTIVSAQKLRVAEVANPKTMCAACYVSDVQEVLSPATREYINRRCDELERRLGVEIAVVVVPGIEGDDEYGFAYDLFNIWHIGKQGKNNGLLWLYAVDIRAMKFETGLGLEGLLPDAFLDRVLNETIFPYMREGKADEAFVAGIDTLIGRLTTDEAREELLLNTESPRVVVGEILSFYFSIAFVMLIVLVLIFYARTQNMHGENNVRYAKVKPVVEAVKIFSIFFPFPILLFWLYSKRFLHNLRCRPLKCEVCGGSMRRLSEEEEDAYLNFGQQAEERVKSVDYDVWKCNVCNEVKILAYEKMNTKYTVCPRCGARTYSLVSDSIVIPPTTLSAGKGQKVHACANCGLKNVVSYVIPVIVVPRGGSSSSGSGFGGGGFGGGISGGGGAGGRF